MNAVTEAVEFKPITRTAVLRAMLFADSHVSCAQIAKDAGVSTNAAGASLRRLRDDGIVCSVDSDTGATAWYLNDPEAVRRTLDNDGTPGDDEPAPEPDDTQAVDAVEAAHLITAAYSAAIAAESAADSAPLTGDDVCGADAVIANWKREHAPAAPAAPADPDTPLGCAIARITGPLIAQAEEWESDALRLRHIIGEAIRLASDAQARTPGVSEAHKALEIAASIIEDVQ